MHETKKELELQERNVELKEEAELSPKSSDDMEYNSE